MTEGLTEEHVRIAPSRVPRLAQLITNGVGSTVWRLPLATTVNDLPLAEGALVYGGLGTATAITLLTLAHALLFSSSTRRRRDLTSLVEAAQDDHGLSTFLEGMYADEGKWCSLRLTCELATRAEADLDSQEKTLLSFFRNVASTENLHVSTPQHHHAHTLHQFLPYVWPELCRHLDDKCPYSAHAMMDAYRTAHGKLGRRRDGHLNPSY